MICTNCGKEIHPPQVNKQPFTSSYYCTPCKEEIIVWEDIKQGDHVFQWKDYRIYCDVNHSNARLQRLYMDIESDTSIMYRWYNVLELPAIPKNLNENNVEEKIKLYLLFS